MLKVFLPLIFAVATFVLIRPAFAQEDTACAAPVDTACTMDYQCGYGNICEYGQCQPAQCLSNNTCMPWEKCDQGRCVRDPWAHACSKDQDCFAGYYCWAGYCKHW